MSATTGPAHLRGCAADPPAHEVRPAYRRVEVRDDTGWFRTGTVLGWWSGPEGGVLCLLRLSGSPTARWTVFDPDRIVPLVHNGI